MLVAPTPHARAVLEVLQLPGVGSAKGRELARAAAAQQKDVRELARLRVGATVGAAERDQAARDADRILGECDRLGIAVIALGDPTYPTRLTEISDAPPTLFVLGDPTALGRTGIAVVGTREAGKAGLRAAEVIGEYVVRRGLSVVSGLALGIDAAAHTGALNGSGVTVAILAHGLDTLSPKTNRPIADRLLSLGGALVSEHPPGVPARPAEFVRRNRIQSGMSLCSVVVESGEKGGAMHQAAFTVNQRRPLLTVFSRDASSDLNEAGARRLISEFHAIAIRGTADLGQHLDRFLQHGNGSPSSPSAAGQGEIDW